MLVGCSVGASLVPHMYKLRPAQTKAMTVCGAGYRAPDEVSPHVQFYKDNGLADRWDFTFKDFSPAFGATPMASSSGLAKNAQTWRCSPSSEPAKRMG